MESKLIVYTVLAITIGYLFVSAIPAQLAPSPFLAIQPESDDVRSPGKSLEIIYFFKKNL